MVNLCGRQNLASQKAKILKLKQSMWLLSFCPSVSYIIIYFILFFPIIIEKEKVHKWVAIELASN